MSKKIIFIILFIVICALSGVYYFFRLRTDKQTLVSPKVGPIVEAIYGIGTVTARKQFHFKVGIPKTVIKLFVREGQLVSKGTPLIELSDSVIVKTPITGTVTALPFQPGENVFSDIPIVTVEDLEDRYLIASLDQQGALRIKKGQSVILNFESIREKKFTGIVETVYPQKGQFLVQIGVQNLPHEILPGMTADVAIEAAQKVKAILIPASAISNQAVLVKRDNKQIKINIKLGSMDNEWAEVTSGNIYETDQIVIKK